MLNHSLFDARFLIKSNDEVLSQRPKHLHWITWQRFRGRCALRMRVRAPPAPLRDGKSEAEKRALLPPPPSIHARATAHGLLELCLSCGVIPNTQGPETPMTSVYILPGTTNILCTFMHKII